MPPLTRCLWRINSSSLASFMIDHQDRNASNDLALARHKLGPRPAAVADSWMSSLEAVAFATMGYERDAWVALDRADELCDRIDDREPPWPWVFTFDHDKIAIQRVVCAARLGQPSRVSDLLPTFTPAGNSHRRQQALFSLDLAEVQIQAGDVDQGCELATSPVQQVAPYGSGRVVERAAALRGRNAKRIPRRQLEAFDEWLRRAS
jgi:hypothetical protein